MGYYCTYKTIRTVTISLIITLLISLPDSRKHSFQHFEVLFNDKVDIYASGFFKGIAFRLFYSLNVVRLQGILAKSVLEQVWRSWCEGRLALNVATSLKRRFPRRNKFCCGIQEITKTWIHLLGAGIDPKRTFSREMPSSYMKTFTVVKVRRECVFFSIP